MNRYFLLVNLAKGNSYYSHWVIESVVIDLLTIDSLTN